MALVRKNFVMQVDGPPRGRGRLKRTWMEVVTIDLKKCNLSKDLAWDALECRNIIHVAEPKNTYHYYIQLVSRPHTSKRETLIITIFN